MYWHSVFVEQFSVGMRLLKLLLLLLLSMLGHQFFVQLLGLLLVLNAARVTRRGCPAFQDVAATVGAGGFVMGVLVSTTLMTGVRVMVLMFA